MNTYTIAFDVGGSFIKSVVLNQDGEVVLNTYAIFPSKAKESRENILEHLVFIIKEQTNRILDPNFKIMGVGYAFPGPFDYVNGISYIKDVDKFEQLYNVNLRQLLLSKLHNDLSFQAKIHNDFQIVFENDASLFALGEQIAGNARSYRKSIFITIGTGAGSAFMENGRLIKNRYDVPDNGWIYNLPFKNSIVDDYISKRGIIRLAKNLDITMADNEIKALAEMAQSGNAKARKVFYQFGKNIGEVLNSHIHAFKPDAIIFGGQIAKSKALFIKGILEVLEDKAVHIESSLGNSFHTFIGISNLLRQTSHPSETS